MIAKNADHIVLRTPEAVALCGRINRLVKRPGKVIVYQHRRHGTIVLAEQYGRSLIEWVILENWPKVTSAEWAAIVRTLRPTAESIAASRRDIMNRQRIEQQGRLNLGRAWRESWERAGHNHRRAGKIAGQHYLYNMPRVKGD